MEPLKKQSDINKGQTKENRAKNDNLAPTPIDLDKANNEPSSVSSLTPGELQNRLDLYARFSKDTKQAFDIELIRQKYQTEMQRREVNRMKQAVNYSQGVVSGLPHANYHDIQNGHERQDMALLNSELRKAKEIYNDAQNLRKDFEANKTSLSEFQLEYLKAKSEYQPKSQFARHFQAKARDIKQDNGKDMEK